MTVLVGIRCTDGVVIGADSAMTFGISVQQPTIEQPHPNKISIINDKIILAGTGYIGHDQRFMHEVGKLSNTKNDGLRGCPVVEVGRKLAEVALRNFTSTGSKSGQYGALVALPVDGKSGTKAELIEFPVIDFQPEVKTSDVWYASMGAAQGIADPLLGFARTAFWNDGAPDLQEGIFTATFVLGLACDMAPYGVERPLQMAILRKGKEGRGGWRASRLTQDELAEHEESVKGAIRRLGKYRLKLAGEDQPDVAPPEPPVGGGH